MELSSTESLWAALAIALLLTAVHLTAPAWNRRPAASSRAAASFGGGIAVAYVFLHLLPELAAGNEAIAEALGSEATTTPLLELAIFGVALIGFVLFFALERAAEGRGDSATLTFRLHFALFFLYNALITYTMPLRLRTGVDFALLFTAAMALHFLLTDRGLAHHYPQRFPRRRPLLALGLLAGWGAAVIAAPVSPVVVSLLVALLGGAVLLNVFKEELPSDRESRVGWFLGGAGIYAVLLALVTATSA